MKTTKPLEQIIREAFGNDKMYVDDILNNEFVCCVLQDLGQKGYMRQYPK